MTGVGDEVRPHPFRRPKRGAIGKPDQRRSAGNRPYTQVPGAIRSTDPDEFDVGSPSCKDGIQRKRMANGKTKVATNDRSSEHGLGGSIGGFDGPGPDNQGRFVDRVENCVRIGIWAGHDAVA